MTDTTSAQPDARSRRRFLKASSMLGVAVAFGPATIGEAFADSRIAEKEDTMTQTSATQAADKTAIRPFRVNVPEAEQCFGKVSMLATIIDGSSRGSL
jgi:hypothetical protein